MAGDGDVEAEYHQPPRPATGGVGDTITLTGSNIGVRMRVTLTGLSDPISASRPPRAGTRYVAANLGSAAPASRSWRASSTKRCSTYGARTAKPVLGVQSAACSNGFDEPLRIEVGNSRDGLRVVRGAGRPAAPPAPARARAGARRSGRQMEPAMTWRELNLCVADERNYCALMDRMASNVRSGHRRGGLAFAFALTGAAASAEVTGAVGGVRDPAAGGARPGRLAIEDDGVGPALRARAVHRRSVRRTAGAVPGLRCRADAVDPTPCPATIRAERRDQALRDGVTGCRSPWCPRTWPGPIADVSQPIDGRQHADRLDADGDGVDRLGRDLGAPAVRQRTAAAPRGNEPLRVAAAVDVPRAEPAAVPAAACPCWPPAAATATSAA